MSALIEHYTYDDYANWEGEWELINGMPIAMAPAPMIKHQSLASVFIIELGNEIEECENCAVLGEEDWKICDDTVVRPDVVLICDEPSETYITKAPEIIVEVISKSTAKKMRYINLRFMKRRECLFISWYIPMTVKRKSIN